MFNTIKPSDEAYADTRKELDSIKNAGGFDYNGLALFLNSQELGTIVTLDLPKSRVPALKQQLAKRGLDNGVDVEVVAAEVEDDEGNTEDKIFVTKISDKEGKAVKRSSPPGRKKKA